MTSSQTWLTQLKSTNVNQRSEAVLALGRLADTDAIQALVDVLCHDDALNIREDAVWSLARMGSAAVQPLLDALKEANAHARHNIAHALGKIGDVRAAQPLISLLHDPDEAVRLKTVYVLGQLGAREAVEPLTACLNDVSESVRWTTIEVLAGYGEGAVDALHAMLHHHEAQAREGAASTLGRIECPQSITALLDALNDEDAEVRLAVVQALGELGAHDIAPTLESLRDDPDPRVRIMVGALLKTMK